MSKFLYNKNFDNNNNNDNNNDNCKSIIGKNTDEYKQEPDNIDKKKYIISSNIKKTIVLNQNPNLTPNSTCKISDVDILIENKLIELVSHQHKEIHEINVSNEIEFDKLVKLQAIDKKKFEKLQQDELEDLKTINDKKIKKLLDDHIKKQIQYKKYLTKNKHLITNDNEEIFNHNNFVTKKVTFNSAKNTYYSYKFYGFRYEFSIGVKKIASGFAEFVRICKHITRTRSNKVKPGI